MRGERLDGCVVGTYWVRERKKDEYVIIIIIVVVSSLKQFHQ
jgi:hypothetical protein